MVPVAATSSVTSPTVAVEVRYAVGVAALAVRPPIATQMAPIPTAPSTSTATIFVFIPLLWIRDRPNGAQAHAARGRSSEARLRRA